MDRSALLLYLRDLRDLEIVKRKIIFIIENESQIYKIKLNDLSEPNLVKVPEKEPIWTEEYTMRVMIALFCFFGAISTVKFLIMPFFKLSELSFWQFCLVFIFPIGFVLIGIGMILSIVYKKYQNKKDIIKAKEKNSNEILRVKEQEGMCIQLRKHWQQREDYLKSELRKVNLLLKENYGLNILANQYRNLASLYYIYDYMSSSQENLKDTLIHEHMENGIQRILKKLDYIIEQNQEIIFHNRILEADNEKIIKQNKGMLSTLKQTEINTEMAAQYAEISANYSKVNTFFSCANYLK